jgi:hypothetical protein
MEVRETACRVLPEVLRERLVGLMEREWSAVISGELSAAEAEERMVELSRRVGRELLGEALSERFGRQEGPRRECACGGVQRFERYQPKGIQTVLGATDYARAYYRCRTCGATYYAGDGALGITETSYTYPAQEAVSLVCSGVPFAEARQMLGRLTGLQVSLSHLQRLAERHGGRVEAQEQGEREALFGQRLSYLSAERPNRLYVTLDGTQTPFQDGWHETRVGAVYVGEPNAEGQDEAGRTTYVTGVRESVAAFGQRLYQEAERRGLRHAKEVVVVADGAPWIWNLVAEHLPQRVEILDFYHAAERLHSVGHAVYGEGTEASKRWAATNRQHLLAGRVDRLLRSLRRLRPKRAEGREVVRRAIHYFSANRRRMRYDQLRARGYHIGSGVVEAGCKHVVGSRCKRAGMHWSTFGAQSILSLRCHLLNDRWDDYWQPLKSAA